MATKLPPTWTPNVKSKHASLKLRAGQKGLEFSMSKQHLHNLMMEEKCFFTGVPLNSVNRSIDRKDSSKGYTDENTVACDVFFNMKKSNKTMEETMQLLEREKKELQENKLAPTKDQIYVSLAAAACSAATLIAIFS